MQHQIFITTINYNFRLSTDTQTYSINYINIYIFKKLVCLSSLLKVLNSVDV